VLIRRLIFSGLFYCVLLPVVFAADLSRIEADRNYLVHVWQTDRGLPQNWVSSIAQTPDGYLWVGTRYGGLARFDGVRFVAFNQQNTGELRDVQVEHLSVDETGRLWIIMGNESLTTVQYGRFQLFRPPRSEPRLRLVQVLCVRTNFVLFSGEGAYLGRLNLAANKWEALIPPREMEPIPQTFLLDRDDVVWFVTQQSQLGQFVEDHFQLVSQGLPESAVVALAKDTSRQVWAATPHHLLAWDGHEFLERTPTNGPPPNDVLQIAFSGDGGLWVLEKERLRKMVKGQWTVEIIPNELKHASGVSLDAPVERKTAADGQATASDWLDSLTSGTFSLHGDAQGNAWLISNGRGLLHCKSDGTARLLTERTGLPSLFITDWFQDAGGDIWIGLHGGGVAQISERLFHSFGQADGLPGRVVSSLCLDAGDNLWAGTMSGGLARWKDHRFVAVPLPEPASNPNESVTVFPAQNGGIWIGTLNHGLLRFRFGKISRPPVPFDNIRVLSGDSRGRLWGGELAGLFCIDHGQLKQYGAADGFVDSHAVGDVEEDAAGAMWIGTGPGELWKYYGGKFTRFTPPTEWPSVRFSDVLPDTNNVVWIGTLGGGLLRFANGQFTRFRKEDGLPDNNVSQLLDSHDGYIWGGTYAGIFRVSKASLEAVAAGQEKQLQCRVYGVFDGLPALECSSGFQPSCWSSADGHLWFSTANGVTSVDPAGIIPNPIPPTVIIEEMLVDGKAMTVSPHIGAPLATANSLDPVKIPPGRHYVQFRYTGLNFAAPDGVHFRVKLERGEEKWQDAGGQRTIGYGPLLPGNYRFHVAACNNDGVWNNDGDTLSFTVLPYFWETRWFKVGLGLLTLAIFAAVGSLIQRQRYRRRLERAERQHEMEQERARIARDLHDDLGTSITQISLLSALAYRDKTSPEETKELIQQVRGRATEMVVALDEIVWAVNPQNDSLSGLVSYLGYFAEEFFRAGDIRFRLDVPSHLPSMPLSADTRHHLFLAFKEALNNAARHAGAKQVSLRVAVSSDEVVISVEDDGRGFSSEMKSSQGNGLANMKRRLEQIGGELELNSQSGRGTSIAFHVPLNKSQKG